MEIEAQIREFMNEIALKDQSYNNNLGSERIDSIQYIELITMLEDEYDISFPDELLILDNNHLVERLAMIIQKLIDEKVN